MALGSPVVTKVSVTYPQEGLYRITLNLTVPDDSPGWDGIDQNFSEDYKTGNSFGPTALVLGKAMQAAIDRYKLEKSQFNNATLDAAVSTIQNGLTV